MAQHILYASQNVSAAIEAMNSSPTHCQVADSLDIANTSSIPTPVFDTKGNRHLSKLLPTTAPTKKEVIAQEAGELLRN